MKKFLLSFILLSAVLFASTAHALVLNAQEHKWDADKRIDLGVDAEKMTWYLGQYGKINNIPYAIVRRYYSGSASKARYQKALNGKIASKKLKIITTLYFTEYGYEFSEDGESFFTIYAHDYNTAGQLIYKEEADDVSAANQSSVLKSFGARKAAPYAMASKNEDRDIDDGLTDPIRIPKVSDSTDINTHFTINGGGEDPAPIPTPVPDPVPDPDPAPNTRKWQKGIQNWRNEAKYQFTNWSFSPKECTVELFSRNGRKIGTYSLTPVKDRGFVYARGVEKGTQFTVPDGCEVHCDPAKVDTTGKRNADKRGNGVAFYPGEVVYYKQDTSPGFTIFPYHAWNVD